MQPRTINDTFSVSPQIHAEDVAELARQGFRSIICNRPDGEGADQTEYAAIERAAAEAGLETRYVPVVPGNIGNSDIEKFAHALEDLPSPTLAYCRSGTRSATLWALTAGSAGKSPNDILRATLNAGYDLSGLAGRIAATRSNDIDTSAIIG